MEKVFIVGLYKSGTSWLLQCLGTHPDMVAVSELDIIRAVNGNEVKVFNALPQVEVLKNIFGRSAFMNMPKAFIEENEEIYHWTAEKMLSALKGGRKLKSKQAHTPINVFINCLLASGFQHPLVCRKIAFENSSSTNLANIVSFDYIGDEYLLNAINSIRASNGAIEMMEAFVQCIESMFSGQKKMLVLKGADQVARFALLEQWMPHAKKIAIVRDGRDACISAQHFRLLMKERDAAFVPKEASVEFKVLLEGWRSRAQMLIDLKGQQNLKIIRYEDLLDDFESTMSDLFTFLGMSVDKELLTEIKLRNSFQVVTGRRAGNAAKDIRRSGIYGEWTRSLTKQQKNESWEIAGQQLEAFGYRCDARLNPLPASL